MKFYSHSKIRCTKPFDKLDGLRNFPSQSVYRNADPRAILPSHLHRKPDSVIIQNEIQKNQKNHRKAEESPDRSTVNRIRSNQTSKYSASGITE